MTAHLSRRRALHVGLALGATLALPSARACEIQTSTLRITHPWTRATAPDATSAVLCMKFDEVVQEDRLVFVETPVALAAEMSGVAGSAAIAMALDFPIPVGEVTYLHEAGPHVRLLGLRFALEVGRSYPLTLGFEKGGVYQAVLTVDYTRFK